MFYVINGHELEHIEIEQLRGFENVRTATVDLGGDIGEVKLAMCHGLRGVRDLVEKILAGEAHFDFIEIMACPGGCVDEADTCATKRHTLPHAKKRRDTLYAIDKQSSVRSPTTIL